MIVFDAGKPLSHIKLRHIFYSIMFELISLEIWVITIYKAYYAGLNGLKENTVTALKVKLPSFHLR